MPNERREKNGWRGRERKSQSITPFDAQTNTFHTVLWEIRVSFQLHTFCLIFFSGFCHIRFLFLSWARFGFSNIILCILQCFVREVFGDKTISLRCMVCIKVHRKMKSTLWERHRVWIGSAFVSSFVRFEFCLSYQWKRNMLLGIGRFSKCPIEHDFCPHFYWLFNFEKMAFVINVCVYIHSNVTVHQSYRSPFSEQ